MKITLALLSIAALALAGCGSPRNVANLLAAQQPGQASGAGATLTGPTNAATPSTQTAERVIEYFGPEDGGTEFVPPSPAAVTDRASDAPAASRVTRLEPRADVASRDEPRPAGDRAVTQPRPPRPRYVHEKVTTTIGQHQDAAGILAMAAKAASDWGWLRWVGVVCMLAGVAGWLWSVGNPAGYPLVFVGVAGCGVLFVFAAENPAWLLVLLLPVGFYGAQKIGVFRALP